MVHYDAHAELRVTDPARASEAAAEIADAAGGFVEHSNSSSVTLRIPVERFRETLAKLLALGEVVSKSVTARDVTDAYTDVDLRLGVARATRERLIALLASATKEKERIELLKEIQRLSEEIDQLETNLATLKSLAALSRVTLSLLARQPLGQRGQRELVAEFRWIDELSPFRNDVAQRGERLALAEPKGMVALSKDGPWVAESADGVVLRTSRHPNVPRGSTSFWLQAIRSRLAPEFASAETSSAGDFELIELVDRADDPYHYVVGVRAAGDHLDLVEVHYPSRAQVDRYRDAVLAVIAGGSR